MDGVNGSGSVCQPSWRFPLVFYTLRRSGSIALCALPANRPFLSNFYFPCLQCFLSFVLFPQAFKFLFSPFLPYSFILFSLALLSSLFSSFLPYVYIFSPFLFYFPLFIFFVLFLLTHYVFLSFLDPFLYYIFLCFLALAFLFLSLYMFLFIVVYFYIYFFSTFFHCTFFSCRRLSSVSSFFRYIFVSFLPFSLIFLFPSVPLFSL
jgi:hypothetical protein